MEKKFNIGDEVRLTPEAFEQLKDTDNGSYLLAFNTKDTYYRIIGITNFKGSPSYHLKLRESV